MRQTLNSKSNDPPRRPARQAAVPLDDLELRAPQMNDQAHFSEEFKDFTGHTPTAYLELRRRFPVETGFPPDNGPMPAD
jgi:hypothetical protein